MINTIESVDIMAMASEIVAAYISNNEIEQENIPTFIKQIHQIINRLNSNQTFFFSPRSEPAVPIEDSITISPKMGFAFQLSYGCS